MVGFIDIKTLTFDELVGIVNLYPWFGGARKELCLRMAAMGDGALSEDEMAAAAMYLPSRRILADVVRRTVAGEFKDADVENIIKSYVVQKETSGQSSKRRVYAGAGDYFSQEEYDRARQEGDNVFSRASLRAGKEPVEYVAAASDFDFFTETLAQIYAEQGYYEQARDIYSKLILAYPEKNAYFAALIEKLDESN